MNEINKYKLPFELFGNIIVFNNENVITFAGYAIIKALSLSGIDIEKIIEGKFSDEDGQNLLTTLNKVRENHKTYSFKFKKSPQEFILLPAHGSDKKNVFLSLKGVVDRISTIEHNLGERVKELECLYKISHEIQISKDVNEALEKSTEHIKYGFQFPEEATVVIEYKGKKFVSAGGSETKIKNMLSDENILNNERKRGEIRVIYHKKLPFLKEEIYLLREVSRKFTKAIEREEKTRILERQRKILLSKNEKLLELTEQCKESREQLQSVFRAITDKILEIDSDYNILLSNSDEIGNNGKCYQKLFKLEEPCKECPAQITFKTAKMASFDMEYNNHFFKLRSFPIFNKEGSVDKILEICRNVSKEKKMESQLIESHKLASLGKLVAGVAHEINNPNTFILGNTKIVKEALTDLLPIAEAEFIRNPDLKIARLNYDLFKENITTLIDDIYNGAGKIKKIVEELRNFAKKDEDVLTDTVYINNVVENTVRLIKKQIKENVKIRMELKQDLPEFTGSISRLEQVIINLVMNASQAIGNNPGEILLKTGFDAENNHVILTVSDNGKGMDETTKRNVFDPFFTTKRNEGGIGLGLSISDRIIKEHKGEIEIDTQLGRGTTFTIVLPVNHSENGSNTRN
jgi:signal transduction histidine kinase